jgi:hypothetical protein
MATGWTTPRTWVAGEVFTASNANTHIRDDMEFAAGATKPSFRVFKSANQTITTSTPTAITFDSERYDTQNGHSTSSNTSRYTVQTGQDGVWSLGGCVEWAAVNTTGTRQLELRLNGTTIVAFDTDNAPSATLGSRMIVNTEYRLAATDYVELVVNQTSGGNLAVNAAANYSPEMWGHWVSA